MKSEQSSTLTDLFVKNAQETSATVVRVKASPEAVEEALRTPTQGARSIAVAEGEWLPQEIFAAVRRLPNVLPSPSEEQLAQADAGVTEAFAAVASSGSICVTLGKPLVAAASLLMPLHIALLRAERIVDRPRALFDEEQFAGEGLRRNLVFITGPSATADMGPLVRGVHGPHRLYVLVLE